jgi:hypothetical protein
VTRAEQLSVGVTSALALAATFAYAVDAAGLGIAPLLVLLLAGAGAALLSWSVASSRGSHTDTLVWAGIIAFVLAALVRPAWPALVLPGRGPDLAHHLLLVDYIEQHRQLVHDRSLDGSMGEMAHYTPGAHVLAVLFGSWFGVDGLRAFFPLLASCAALTAGFVFLIARRLVLPLPYAIAAVILLFLPSQYFYGAFTHDSFLAQTVATFFAVAAWWALIAWDEERSTMAAIVFSIFLVAVFLTWPVFVGPVVVVFVALALSSHDPPKPWRRRTTTLAIGLVPLAVVAATHAAGRWGWLGLVRTSGAVLRPGWESIGWLLPLLTLIGLLVTLRDRRARVTIVFLLVIVLQAVTLFVLAKSQGADTPYMAFKMVYLAIYPAAVLAAVAMASPERAMLTRSREHSESKGAVGWIIAAVLLIAAVRPALTAPRAVPVIDLDLYEAGKWTRANIGQTCVDYLVADAETAYWLHLAVLGNPRSSQRMIEIDRYEPRAAMGPWITAEGRSYAIADLRLLPDEVRSRVEIVSTFGNAAVIKRPGVMIGDCDLGR